MARRKSLRKGTKVFVRCDPSVGILGSEGKTVSKKKVHRDIFYEIEDEFGNVELLKRSQFEVV